MTKISHERVSMVGPGYGKSKPLVPGPPKLCNVIVVYVTFSILWQSSKTVVWVYVTFSMYFPSSSQCHISQFHSIKLINTFTLRSLSLSIYKIHFFNKNKTYVSVISILLFFIYLKQVVQSLISWNHSFSSVHLIPWEFIFASPYAISKLKMIGMTQFTRPYWSE